MSAPLHPYEVLLGPSGSVIVAGLRAIGQIPPALINQAIELLDEGHLVGQGLTFRPDDEEEARQRAYTKHRGILGRLATLRSVLGPSVPEAPHAP
jgi:hypothetical protein